MVNVAKVTENLHVGNIVKDIQKTVDNLSKIGIGPFANLNAEPTVKWEENGKPIDVKLKMKFAKFGSLEIELIEPISQCMQKEFLDKKGEGVNHVAYFVDD